MNFWTHEGFGKARELLHQAIAVDPESAGARRDIAWLAVVGLISGLDKPPVPPQEIVAQASQAVRTRSFRRTRAHGGRSRLLLQQQLDLFEHEAKQAMALAPYDAESLATLAGRRPRPRGIGRAGASPAPLSSTDIRNGRRS